ncbi:MAG: zinc ribbon domain-containing protein [Tannerella sp.]|jgi:hypothetical protein|nr:zinc ribbon domain-containing protein [Tannerella sp.]
MKAGQVFSGTMQFCWLKLLVGVLHIVVAAALFALLMGISLLFKSQGVGIVMLLIWFSLLGIINFIFRHYLGYLLKAGHVAVIARSFLDDRIPDAPFRTGARMVKERFGTANVYFVIDKLVAGAVKQLQRTFGNLTGMLGAVPGLDALTKLGKMFIEISLGYVDECCLGYTFYNEKQSAFKSAADGVVVYAQNWKTLLKNAAVTMFVVLLSFAIVTVVALLLFAGAFRLLGLTTEWSGILGFVLAVLTAWTVKYAFIDTWILVKMMSTYMGVAPTTQITFDLYSRLRGISSKFGELLKRAESEPGYTQPAETPAAPQPAQDTAPRQAGSFCPQCGQPVAIGTKFCGACGSRTGQP